MIGYLLLSVVAEGLSLLLALPDDASRAAFICAP
jgi:hypothetical protein